MLLSNIVCFALYFSKSTPNSRSYIFFISSWTKYLFLSERDVSICLFCSFSLSLIVLLLCFMFVLFVAFFRDTLILVLPPAPFRYVCFFVKVIFSVLCHSCTH